MHEESLLRFSQDLSNIPACNAGQDKVKFWLKHPNITEYSDVSKYECDYVFGNRIGKYEIDFLCRRLNIILFRLYL